MTFCSESPNDCAVVALHALTQEPREAIVKEVWYTTKGGTRTTFINEFLVKRGFCKRPIPRRGQSSMNGVIRFASYSKSMSGHLALILNGHVYDHANPTGCPIDIYRTQVKHDHITDFWTKGI